MKKRIIVFLSVFCLILAGLGCFAVSASGNDIAKVNAKFSNSEQSDNTRVTSRNNYASIISRNSAHNGRYKTIIAEVYSVSGPGISDADLDDYNITNGNNYHLDSVITPDSANNFLAIGAMGNTSVSATGYEEYVVILTKKTNGTYSLNRYYYNDYLD